MPAKSRKAFKGPGVDNSLDPSYFWRTMECLTRVSHFLKSLKVETNIPVLLACSGGLDSVTLLHILIKLGFKPGVAHCNFRLRGTESDGDENFVEALAKRHDLPFHSSRFDTSQYAKKQGISTQMAARELRYNFFDELQNNYDYRYLLTAHHQDDSLETLLINLGRGSGILGMGIRSRQENILRPLSSLPRLEITAYAKAYSLEWREDSSNQKDDYQRNYIRHHVIPPLKESIPGFKTGLATSLQNLESDTAFFKDALQRKLQEIILKKEGEEHFPFDQFQQVPFIRTLLHAWLAPYGFNDIEAIMRSLQQESGATFYSEKHELLRDRKDLILRPRESEKIAERFINKTDTRIDQPLQLRLSSHRSDTFEMPSSSKVAALDYDKLEFPLQLRFWQKGDRFRPLGMKGFKKLSDFFTDQKLNRFEKERVLLLCSGDQIAWVAGYRIDDRFKVSDKTKTVYFVELLN